MGTIPESRSELKILLGRLFPRPDAAGLNWRAVDRPGAPPATVVWLEGLIDPDDVQRLALGPANAGLPDAAPADLARTGGLTAPRLEPTDDLDALQAGLLGGCTALHLAGRPGVLLIGSEPRPASPGPFTESLSGNTAALRRHLRYTETRLEPVQDAEGKAGLLIYLEGSSAPGLVSAVRALACRRGLAGKPAPGWRRAAGALLLPEVVTVTSPGRAADLIRRGYVAILTEGQAFSRVAPVTLDLLVRGYPPAAGRAALLAVLTLGAGAALGPFGLALGAFLLLASLGSARACGHPLRRGPAGGRA